MTVIPNIPEKNSLLSALPQLSPAMQAAFDLTLRGCAELLLPEEWMQKLQLSERTGKALKIKLGLDPTAPDLHLGHTVVLHKLRQLQNLGHQVILLIGDFTSMIGDPSGRDRTRPMLDQQTIMDNAQTYAQQAYRILDPQQTQIAYNSQWLQGLTSSDFVRLLAQTTLARILERDDFTQRYRSNLPISLHELIYPLLQGYDSVMLQTDLEIGGTDQKFNLLMGRELQKAYQHAPQCILTMPLLVGLDGVEKMSKSKGNAISICEAPQQMFGQLMSISDEMMWHYYLLLSNASTEAITALQRDVQDGRNPRDIKVKLAEEIVTRFHSQDAARQSCEAFEARSRGEVPENIVEFRLIAPMIISDVLKQINFLPSKAEAARHIEQGGVKINGQKIADKQLTLAAGDYLLQVGKRKFARIVLTAPGV